MADATTKPKQKNKGWTTPTNSLWYRTKRDKEPLHVRGHHREEKNRVGQQNQTNEVIVPKEPSVTTLQQFALH